MALAPALKDVQHKDTSRYQLALAQTLDSLRASTAWIEVSIQGRWSDGARVGEPVLTCVLSVRRRTSLSGSGNAVGSCRLVRRSWN